MTTRRIGLCAALGLALAQAVAAQPAPAGPLDAVHLDEVIAARPTAFAEPLRTFYIGRETSVALPEPVPIHVGYWTAWVEADGAVHFRDDLYGRDRALDRALTAAP